MSRSRFARGLVFASLGGLGAVPFGLVTAGALGYATATALYTAALVPVHLLVVAPTRSRGIRAALLATSLTLAVVMALPEPAVIAALIPFLLGVPRSAILFPRRLARALFFEIGFSTAALLLASLFADGILVGDSFAVWTFWLVQAGFAVAPEDAPSAVEQASDPFVAAHAAATAVLERRP